MKAIVTYQPYSEVIEKINIPLEDSKYFEFYLHETQTDDGLGNITSTFALSFDYFDGVSNVNLLQSNLEDSKHFLKIIVDMVRELSKK